MIGVTGGAGFGAILILLVFPSSIALLPVGALLFGLLAAAIVFVVAWSGPERAAAIGRLILAGIAISALFAAGMTSLMALHPDRVPVGDLLPRRRADDERLERRSASSGPTSPSGSCWRSCSCARSTGSRSATTSPPSLGVRPRLIRLGAGVAAALLAASAAALAGLLDFVGLVVPHVVRLAGGTASHWFVVPASRARRRGAAARGRHARAHGHGADRAARRPADGGARRAAVPVAAAESGVSDAPGTAAAPAGATPLLDARDVRVEIGGTPILHGADLSVAAGELVAVVGPNGAGKSTLARAVAGPAEARRRHGRVERRGRRADCAAASSRGCARSCRSARACRRGSTVREAVRIGRSPHVGPLRRA